MQPNFVTRYEQLPITQNSLVDMADLIKKRLHQREADRGPHFSDRGMGFGVLFSVPNGLNMNEHGKMQEGQIISGPLFNGPMRVETGRASAEIDDKVAHYYLSVDALTQPMQVCEGQAPYGGKKS
jgi:hypothetical protein